MTDALLSNPWFYAAAVPAVLSQAISKSGFGSSIGILAMPLIALVVSPSRGAAILLPLLLVMDVMGWFTFKGQGDKVNLKILIPAGIAGVIVGTLTFRYLSDAWLRLIIGVISVGFAIQRLHGLRTGALPTQPSLIKGGFWGMVSGLTSFIANAGGPPLQVYLVPQQLPKLVFVGTTVIYFSVVNISKSFPFYYLGLFNVDNLMLSLALLPAAPLGYWIGYTVLSKIDQDKFYNIITVAVFITGLKLLWDGARGLLMSM